MLILTTFDDDQTVATALAAGAAGFLLKDAPGEDLIRATRTVGDGGAWLDPAVAGTGARGLPHHGAPARPGDRPARRAHRPGARRPRA